MIRPAQADDTAALAELITQLGYPTAPEEMKKRMELIMRDKTYATFVAVEENRVRGMIGISISQSYEHNCPTGRIIALAIDASWRRRGLGRELVAFAENHFERENVRRIAVTSHRRRTEAHKFYESLGYAATGLRFFKELPAR